MPDPVALPSAMPPNRPSNAPNASADDPLWTAAKQLEQSFLSEMLKAAGFGEARQAFGGGIGEEQFASFLREQHAEKMVDRGGIGLAEALYRSLTEARNGN